jgi:6-phosphogluconolactonase
MTAKDVEIVVLDDPAQAAAELLAEAARAHRHIALAGGSTPRRAYELAAELLSDWTGAHVWWSDERCVPPDHPLSNHRLAAESLLERLAAGPEVHRIRGEAGPREAAAGYHDELDGVTLDLTLLGIGADGHTASLFPRAPALEERERRAVAAPPALEPLVDRVTLTLPPLCASRLVVFLVAGRDKAGAVRRAFVDEPSPTTPASLVRSSAGRTVVLLDPDAAAGVPSLHRQPSDDI